MVLFSFICGCWFTTTRVKANNKINPKRANRKWPKMVHAHTFCRGVGGMIVNRDPVVKSFRLPAKRDLYKNVEVWSRAAKTLGSPLKLNNSQKIEKPQPLLIRDKINNVSSNWLVVTPVKFSLTVHHWKSQYEQEITKHPDNKTCGNKKYKKSCYTGAMSCVTLWLVTISFSVAVISWQAIKRVSRTARK